MSESKSESKYGKTALINEVASTTGLTQKQVALAINATLATIQRKVQNGESVTLTGFGTFRATQRSARTGVNPQTKKPLQIPARVAAHWSPANGFMDASGDSARYAQERAAGNRLEEKEQAKEALAR